MLVLSRKLNESIVIGSSINLCVLSIRGNTVRLGIEAPPEMPIRRAELLAQPGPPPSTDATSKNVGRCA